MRMVSRRTVVLALAAVLSFFATGVRAQDPSKTNPPKQQPPTQTPPPAAPQQGEQQEAPKLNPEEEASYKTFSGLKASDTQAVIDQGEGFLKKYPESRYRASVYARLVTAYQATGQEQKMFDTGEKALQLNPDEVDVLAIMAWALPRRISPGQLDADQKLQKAQQYAKHAMELLSNMQKPAGISDEDFNKAKNSELASCHSGLGLVYYHQNNIPGMISEMEEATKVNPTPDPVDFYLLGVGYEKAQRHSDAVTAFTRCSDMAGPIQARCKTGMEQAKKQAAQSPAPKP